MKIAAKGQDKQLAELSVLVNGADLEAIDLKSLEQYDLIFDLDFDENPENITAYTNADCTIVVGAVKTQLEEIIAELGAKPKCTLIGWNTLPTFINRPLAEYTLLDESDASAAEVAFAKLGIEGRLVNSRVGMVTPRIVCMIINEAFYTVQEGTANRSDIDLGMKLGTAYPKGPFEWCEQIGIDNVYETLEALFNDTKDERYKICPLLKTEYLKSFID